MAEREINPVLKQVLEMGPVLLFVLGFFLLKAETYEIAGQEYKKFIVLTGCFVVLTVIATGILWRLTGTLSKMQLFTLVLVTVLGGLSVWLNDEKFIKMKPTLLYIVFAGILAFGVWRGQSYLDALMGSLIPMENEGWMILTRRFILFFLFLALANEVVWRTMSTGTWLTFKLVGITGGMFIFIMAQHKLFDKYAISDDAPKG